MSDNLHTYIRRCLELAKNGLGHVAPNPMVGSVIVHNDRIIGEGYHKAYGGPHAEVNAIHAVHNKELLKESTLYVNLEPCSHHGKTPPCADLIIRMGIPNVVIGNIDPFEEVAGRGIRKLKDAGINVVAEVLNDECSELNKRFLTFHTKKRPYIILKWAQTSDGFIDIIRGSHAAVQPTWITDEKLRILVHKWRAEEQAIMVGTNTVEKDNPTLNVRDWCGKNPIRITLDRNLRLSNALHIFDKQAPTIVFTSSENAPSSCMQPEYVTIDFNEDIAQQICNTLYAKNIQSVFIEGGTRLLQTFIHAGLWDEARVFTGSISFKDGVKAPLITGNAISNTRFGNDTLTLYKNC